MLHSATFFFSGLWGGSYIMSLPKHWTIFPIAMTIMILMVVSVIIFLHSLVDGDFV